MFGFESFGKDPSRDPAEEEALADEKIKKEMDDMEEKHYEAVGKDINSEYLDEVEALKQEEEEANKIINLTGNYINANLKKASWAMSLKEFVDLADEDEENFDPEVVNLINGWIGRFPKEVDLEKAVNGFIRFVTKKRDEASQLLNPGPEKTSPPPQTEQKIIS